MKNDGNQKGRLCRAEPGLPEEVISQLHTYSKNLNLFLGSINAGKADPKLLPMAKQSALKILSLIIQHAPFSYMDLNMCKDQIDTCFTMDSL